MADDVAAILPLPARFADNAFALLAGEPALARVVRAMRGVAVVAVAEPLSDSVRETIAAHRLSDIDVVVAEGSGSRVQCLAAGVQHLKNLPRHILIHDIRRPLTPESLRDRVIAALQAGSHAAIPVLPVTDSVKVVDARGSVTRTLDRSTLRAMQYPRGFTVEQLSLLLAGRSSEEFDEVDETLRAGTPITFVDGDSEAFAVELPRDAALVEAIIAEG